MMSIAFTDLAVNNLERVRSFASLPLSGDLNFSRSQMESCWLDEIKELLSDERAVGFIAEIDKAICGFAICAPLSWESPLLGKSMWAIKHIGLVSGCADASTVATELVGEVIRRMGSRDADFLLCKVTPSDTPIIHGLESNGFLLMDTLLNFAFDCHSDIPLSKAPDNFVLRLASSSDIEALAEVARASFATHFGRFHAEPRIGRAAATRIYEQWIRSCAKGWADWIIVAVDSERIAGYSAWKKPSALDERHGIRLAHYSIGAVHPEFSGRGLFTALTAAGMEQLRPSADWIEAPTHIDNLAVQRGFLRLGWRIAGAQHSFHKWLKP